MSEQIAENFGANANYVESMLDRYRSDPAQVDESWRIYFAELLGEPVPQVSGNGRTANAPTINQPSRTTAIEPVKNGAATAPPRATKQTTHAQAPPAGVASSEQTASSPIRGSALKVVENMEESLTVPTATSQRQMPVKVLEENRSVINTHRLKNHRGKASFTHLIAWAIIQSLKKFPQLNDSFAMLENGAVRVPSRVHRKEINLGLAIDITKKDGSRTLLVPNIKNAGALGFSEFLEAYDDIVKRARAGKMQIPDFQGTTISLTNPGTIGTAASTPRLMAGQSMIIATGAIEYPAEYRAMALPTLSQLGISRTLTITNTYDHRIIQGAESGAFLAYVNELLLGEHGFYEDVFAGAGIHYLPLRWAVDHNPALLGGDHAQEQIVKQARVLELINAYRVRGHQIADIDPLDATPVHHHDELDIENYGLTIWDLDREFITGGLGGVKIATLRDILVLLRRSYCGKVGIEYRHIENTERKRWLQERIETAPAPVPVEIKKQILWKLISAEQFERFLHTKYLGQKRFSVEGCESIIP
ncbi:MAG: 2-oxo acid dehydrogenase subunit E2, partial [Pyrinomonadaceae bacterium]